MDILELVDGRLAKPGERCERDQELLSVQQEPEAVRETCVTSATEVPGLGMANLRDVPFDDFLRSVQLRGRQSGLRGQRESGIKPELRFSVRVRDVNVNALAAPSLHLRALTPRADVSVVKPPFSGLRASEHGRKARGNRAEYHPIPTQSRNRTFTNLPSDSIARRRRSALIPFLLTVR